MDHHPAAAAQLEPPPTEPAVARRARSRHVVDAPRPPTALDLSMALATRDRAKVLSLTLQSLTRMDTRGVNWELVVVDNGSADDTRQVAQGFATRLPLRYVYEPLLGKSNALNRVAAELRGRLVSFADDDILFDRHWMKNILAYADAYADFEVFGGPISPCWTRSTRPAYLHHPYARQAYTVCHLGDQPRPYPPESWPPGANAVYRRNVLDPEPFDPAMGPVGNTRLIGNDTALAKRLVAKGARLLYVPDAVVQHIIQPTQMIPPFLWRRAYQRAKTLAVTGPLAPTASLGGVPLWMMNELSRRAARLLASWTGLTRSPRIYAEVDLADMLGWIAGARLAHRRGGPRA